MSRRNTSYVSHMAPQGIGDLEVVTFIWSSKDGYCYDCGLPAAFFLPEEHVAGAEDPNEINKRCGICAANCACDGIAISRIDDY